MGLLSGKDLTIHNTPVEHLESVFKLFKKMNYKTFSVDSNSVHISSENAFLQNDTLRPVNIITSEYPGIPTDLQNPIAILMSQIPGISRIEETIWEDRIQPLLQFNEFGADINMRNNKEAVIKGGNRFRSSKPKANDLRHAFACILGGVLAEGDTFIDNIEYIKRGYENIDQKLDEIGGTIEFI